MLAGLFCQQSWTSARWYSNITLLCFEINSQNLKNSRNGWFAKQNNISFWVKNLFQIWRNHSKTKYFKRCLLNNDNNKQATSTIIIIKKMPKQQRQGRMVGKNNWFVQSYNIEDPTKLQSLIYELVRIILKVFLTEWRLS